jgi:tetratricopeptide (TPR) repeat protein
MYLSRNREAIESLNRAFRVNPKYAENGNYLLAMAAAYGGMGDYEASGKFYTDTARLFPNNADAHHGLGWTLRSMGKGRDAEAPLRRAIALESNDSKSHTELGNALFDMDRWAEAELEYRHVITIGPNKADSHHLLGLTLSKQERYVEAIAEYEEAVKLNPDHEDAYFDLGIAHTLLEHYGKAIEAYESALRVNPSIPDNLLSCLAANYIQCERWSEALQVSERLIQQDPNEYEAHLYLALAYSGLNRDELAIGAYREALRLNPNSSPVLANLGISYFKVEQFSEAASSLEKAIDLDPSEPEARLKLGEVYVKLGNEPAARDQLRILEEAAPDSAIKLRQLIEPANCSNLSKQENS